MLTNNGVGVYTVKTDAFTIRQAQLETAMELLHWERLNTTEDIQFPIEVSLMDLKENRLIQIHEHNTQSTNLTIEDEYNTDKLCGYIEEHQIMMTKAEFGGCGKSFACKVHGDEGAQGPLRVPDEQTG